MNREQLRSSLDMMILFSLERDDLHGYALTERLRRLSDGAVDLATGTIYPALHRLEEGKLIKSKASKVDGRRRRVYSLTHSGRIRLKREIASWEQMQRTVSLVLKSS